MSASLASIGGYHAVDLEGIVTAHPHQERRFEYVIVPTYEFVVFERVERTRAHLNQRDHIP